MEFTTYNWMSKVDGAVKLNEMTIPGTHDAGTYAYDPGIVGKLTTDPVQRCQNLNITQQLEAGIRYLDIRCRYELHNGANDFRIVHGSVDQFLWFSEVQTYCLAFLTSNPGETVIIEITDEDHSGTSKFNDVLAELMKGKPWYNKSDIPQLQNVRGKLVLLKRFDSSIPGIRPAEWTDNAWTQTYNSGAPTENIAIQDCYQVWDLKTVDSNPDGKWMMVKKMILDSVFQPEPYRGKWLYINFASGSTHMWPFQVANGSPQFSGVNVMMNDFLANVPQYHASGVLAMDFPEDQKGLIENVIRLNFAPHYELPDLDGKTVQIFPAAASDGAKWEVENGGKSVGDKVQLWNTDGDRTKWIIERSTGEGGKDLRIRIKNKNAGLYVGFYNDAKNGTKCVLRDKGDDSTLFHIASNTPGHASTPNTTYRLYNAVGHWALAVESENGNLGDSTKIDLWNTIQERACWRMKIVDA